MLSAYDRTLATLSLGSIVLLSGCTRIEDSIRNWGMRQRTDRVDRIEQGQVERLQRDLDLSRARATELEKKMQELLAESRTQGRLSWQLARRYCMDGRFELGSAEARRAVRPPNQAPGQARDVPPSDQLFEQSLPYFREALLHSAIEPNLLFDAALCYANASRVLGWEKDRFLTAVFLFEAVRRAEPKGTRADYQLALLYGKTTNRNLRDVDAALRLLEGVIRRDEYNISARFAFGHLLVGAGRWSDALSEYQKIQEKMHELKKRGNLPTDPTRTPQYQQAARNIEQLQNCMNDRASCEILREAEP